jgi:DNA replication protein DnaC
LADAVDNRESVHAKIDLLLNHETGRYTDNHPQDQMRNRADSNSPLSLLTPEQSAVASEMIRAMMQETHQLIFLQGSAGTGKTFRVQAVISPLEYCGKNCLICGTIGIAAAQYRGGRTLHSVLHRGIDKQFAGSFRYNIARETIQAQHILNADLIIIDDVSMLTPSVAHRVSMTL